MPKLDNERHEAFCNEYIKHFNAVKAYQACYPDSKYNSARPSAVKLLTNDNIQQRLQELKEERAERVNITQDDVLKSILEIRDRCMEKYKLRENGALKANELLGKHLGMFKDKVEVDGKITWEMFIDQLRNDEPLDEN